MRCLLILVLQFILVANVFSLEIDTIRLQLDHSVCYADNIVEKPVKSSSGVIIYPNPNHGTINIEFADFEFYRSIDLYIYNIQGGIIYSSKIKLITNQYTLILSFLKPGFYFISVLQKDKVFVKKIVRY
jgi:hypothetical protein